MEDDAAQNSAPKPTVQTDGTDAAIVSGLFLTTFVVRMVLYKNIGYVIGSMTFDAIIFVIGYLIAKKLVKSLRDFRIVYIVLYLALFLSHFNSIR